jgi:hypothetical protein
MNSAASLRDVLRDSRVWRGSADGGGHATESTGNEQLDGVLPGRGWPKSALAEILVQWDGIGELELILPTLALQTRTDKQVVLVSPPYVPLPAAWSAHGMHLVNLHIAEASERETLWVAEQCLRSGACGAVVCWPMKADDRALRRLQVAAEAERALGFVFRALEAARNPSPAATRLELIASGSGADLRVLKCRGGRAPAHAVALRSRPTT